MNYTQDSSWNKEGLPINDTKVWCIRYTNRKREILTGVLLSSIIINFHYVGPCVNAGLSMKGGYQFNCSVMGITGYFDPQDFSTFQYHTLKISKLMTIVKSEVFSTSGVLPSTESTAYLALSPELLLNLKGASISESQV